MAQKLKSVAKNMQKLIFQPKTFMTQINEN